MQAKKLEVKKLRVLHSASFSTMMLGIHKQMLSEHKAAVHLNIPWDTKIFYPNGVAEDSEISCTNKKINRNIRHGMISSLFSKLMHKITYYKWLKKNEKKYDILVLRYSGYNVLQYLFIKACQKPVYLVSHTLILPELAANKSIGGAIRTFTEFIIGAFSLKVADGLIGVTNEIVLNDKSRINSPKKNSHIYPNGILYKEEKLEDKRSNKIEILFVASYFATWHGLDLLLSDLINSKENFLLHIVGNMPDNYYQMIGSDQRVIVHGILEKNQVAELSKRCHVGLSSFALFRKKMNEACTLKVREYLRLGLPVYAGHRDIFPTKFLFYTNSEAKFDKIISYAKSMQTFSKSEIANSARKYISKDILLNKLYKGLCSEQE